MHLAKPDAIFNVLFGADLAKFVREGNTRGLFKNRAVVSFLTGEPEYLDPLKDEAPAGWTVTGFPWDKIKTPEYMAFLHAYQKKYNDYPRLGSIVGYVTIKSLAAGIAKAKSTDTEKLIKAFKGLQVSTPFGTITYRPQDHQSTMGAFVGKTKNENGKGVMVDAKYADGADYLPSVPPATTGQPTPAASAPPTAPSPPVPSPNIIPAQPGGEHQRRVEWRHHDLEQEERHDGDVVAVPGLQEEPVEANEPGGAVPEDPVQW